MATTRRDYYEILGLSRTASEKEIKSAFRRLARELHPDVSEAPDAQERFREAAEAYEVLSKRETRELYDRFGHEGLRRGGFHATDFSGLTDLSDLFSAFFGDDLFGRAGGRRSRPRRGADMLVEVELELVDAARGARKTVALSITDSCHSCQGSGAKPGSQLDTCVRCGGAGRLQSVARSAFGQMVRTQVCPDCLGGGKLVRETCPECDGEGRVARERMLEVTIPAGIADGQRIRLSGEGHGGSGLQPGDVYVQVHVRPDPRFLRDGDNLVCAVELTVVQAALGARVPVATLDGDVELDFPPGTQPGSLRLLRGKGFPSLEGFGRGDQRVIVNVVVPRSLTREQRELLEQFERLSDSSTYGEGSSPVGLFERLRSAFGG